MLGVSGRGQCRLAFALVLISVQSLDVRRTCSRQRPVTVWFCSCGPPEHLHPLLVLIWEPVFWITGPQSTVAPQNQTRKRKEREERGRSRVEGEVQRRTPAAQTAAQAVQRQAALRATPEETPSGARGRGSHKALGDCTPAVYITRLYLREAGQGEGISREAAPDYTFSCCAASGEKEGGDLGAPLLGGRHAPSSCSRWYSWTSEAARQLERRAWRRPCGPDLMWMGSVSIMAGLGMMMLRSSQRRLPATRIWICLISSDAALELAG